MKSKQNSMSNGKHQSQCRLLENEEHYCKQPVTEFEWKISGGQTLRIQIRWGSDS
ncbi:hypothetical protein HanIR_Chr05g0243881 [Helianthus annuus]|nr:hypothetical protein HanIR_Chr05g0243881 [Helianthus annuus]